VPRASVLTHTNRPLDGPGTWALHLTSSQPKRIVVFVHGFKGKAIKSWVEFPTAGNTRDWWRESDMLFVGYRSTSEPISTISNRLRHRLPEVFPYLPDRYLQSADCRVRDPVDHPYQELVIAGHSLGGVIVRRALADIASLWEKEHLENPQTPVPALLQAQQRLFSPASGGVRIAGWLALLKGPDRWWAAELILSASPAYQELEQGSRMLEDTKRLTERLHREHRGDLAALAARIAWAQHENIVQPEQYESDAYFDTIEGTSHRSVCKPGAKQEAPYVFVETGRIR
jgi:hypothetical protein